MPSSQINLCKFPCTAIKDGIDLDLSCRVLVFSLCSSECILSFENRQGPVLVCSSVLFFSYFGVIVLSALYFEGEKRHMEDVLTEYAGYHQNLGGSKVIGSRF